MSAIGSVCVVVKVPAAAVMCDRNAGAEGTRRTPREPAPVGLRHARSGRWRRLARLRGLHLGRSSRRLSR